MSLGSIVNKENILIHHLGCAGESGVFSIMKAIQQDSNFFVQTGLSTLIPPSPNATLTR